MRYIGNYAFYNCTGLAGTLTILSSIDYLGESSFSRCSSLDKIYIESDSNFCFFYI